MSGLDEIRARVEAATPGPWEWDVNDITQAGKSWDTVVENTVSCGAYCYGGSVQQEVKPADVEFIAHAREDIPRLLAALDAVRVLIEDAETNRGGSSMYCMVTTYELRRALGMTEDRATHPPAPRGFGCDLGDEE